MTRASCGTTSANNLEHRGQTLTAADAHGLEPVPRISATHLPGKGGKHSSARRADRVTERDPRTVNVGAVEVTGTLSGYADLTRRSAPVRVALGTIEGSRPTISGLARVGRTLTAQPGRWSPTSTQLRFRWLAGGRVLRGETGRRLDLPPSVAGKRIKVRVLATAKGYDQQARTSKATQRVRR